MAEKEQMKPFMAVANVNFCINVNKYDKIRERNIVTLAELKNYEPDAKLPAWALYLQLNKGQQIQVGAEIEQNEANNVVQIPFELFEIYANATVELPCVMRGHVEDGFSKMLAPMPEEDRQEFIKKRSKMKDRFVYTQMMARV